MPAAPYLSPAARSWRTTAGPSTLAFHQGMPGYAPTRLIEVPSLADELGVARVFVKEEASRFGLPAFKILGASYAISRAVSACLGVESALPIDELRPRMPGELTLVAATDGNHGRAVAHVARLLGVPARIFTPADITAAAKGAIEAEGATRIELDAPYDDIVAASAADAAADSAATLVQDTSWDGYEEIPQWIVDGYGTLLEEADEQLAAAGVDAVDLVAVPVGVGSLAQAVVRHHRSHGGTPVVLSVEPDAAPAILASLHAGERTTVPTRSTIMAGLNCGTPTGIGWPTLQAGIDAAVTVTDAEAARAVRDLQSAGVDAGPCGAATLAGVRAAARELGLLTPEMTVLLLSTEAASANPLPPEFACEGAGVSSRAPSAASLNDRGSGH